MGLVPGGESAEGGEGFEADVGDLADEAAHVFGVFGDLLLIDHPFEGAAIAEPVLEVVGRHDGHCQGWVDDAGPLLLRGAHFVFDTEGKGEARVTVNSGGYGESCS